jgi:hypothetical protein
MAILCLFVGILIGIFIPGPYNAATREWFKSLYQKVFKHGTNN